MKELKIEIPAGHEIDLENSDLTSGVVKFKAQKPKYPTTVKELKGRHWYISEHGSILNFIRDSITLNCLSSKERTEAFLALLALVEFRDAWNKVDDFVVDWSDPHQYKHTIEVSRSGLIHNICSTTHRVLHFGSSETRDLFLSTFRDLIETAKELL